jgi:hypothetical protein
MWGCFEHLLTYKKMLDTATELSYNALESVVNYPYQSQKMNTVALSTAGRESHMRTSRTVVTLLITCLSVGVVCSQSSTFVTITGVVQDAWR